MEVIRNSTDETTYTAFMERLNSAGTSETKAVKVRVIDRKNKTLTCSILLEIPGAIDAIAAIRRRVTDFEIPSSYDISKESDLKKAWKKYVDNVDEGNRLFPSEEAFVEFLGEMAKKIKSQDFRVTRESAVTELRPDMESFFTQSSLWNEIDRMIRLYSFFSSGKTVVRDHSTILECFLAILSCKTVSPINLFLGGSSESGKTFCAVRAANMFGNDMIDRVSSSSKTAYKYDFDYRDAQTGKYFKDMRGLCILVLEKSEAHGLLNHFKTLMSHDTPVTENRVAIKNNNTGDMESRIYCYIGWPSFIIASVQHDDNTEEHTRALRASPDTSEEKKVEAWRATARTKMRVDQVMIDKPDVKPIQDGLSYFKPYYCANVFAEVLAEIMTLSGRNTEKLYGLIDSFTLLHQLRRPSYTGQRGGEAYRTLFSTLEDNVVALSLFEASKEATESGMQSITLDILEIMLEIQKLGKPLTHRNIFDRLQVDGIPIRSVEELKTHIVVLLNHNLIAVKEKGQGAMPRSYEVISKATHRGKLTPLFIERVAQRLDVIAKEIGDNPIYDNVVYPPTASDTGITGVKLVDALLEQDYLTEANRGKAIYHVFDPEYRDDLFRVEHILLRAGTVHIQEAQLERLVEKERAKLIRAGETADIEARLGELELLIRYKQDKMYAYAERHGEEVADEMLGAEIEELEREYSQLSRSASTRDEPESNTGGRRLDGPPPLSSVSNI